MIFNRLKTSILHRSCQMLEEACQQFTLCAVGDAMELTKALDRYEDIDYTFSGSREGKLLRVRILTS